MEKKPISKNIFWVWLVVILSLSACSPENYSRHLITYNVQDSLCLKVQNKNYRFLKSVEYNEKEHTLILLTGSSFISHPVLYNYSAESGEYLDSIDFSALIDGRSKLSSFQYVSPDSIFLFLLRHNVENDSIIILANGEGKLIKYITPKHPLLASRYYSESDSSLRLDAFSTSPQVVGNKIFFTLYSTHNDSYFNADSLNRIKRPLLGYYDFIKDTTVLNTNLVYPKPAKGYYNWGMHYYDFTINEKGNPVVGFGYTPCLLEWDVKTNNIIRHYLRSVFVDTVLPEQNVLIQQYSQTQPNYSLLHYNNELKMYVRGIFFPSVTYGNFKNIVVYANTDFEPRGEQLNNQIFPINLGNWLYDYSQSYSDNVFTFYKVVPKHQELDTHKIRNEIDAFKIQKKERIINAKCSLGFSKKSNLKYQSNDFIKYASQRLNIQDSSYVLFSLQENSCNGCANYILNFFSINKKVLADNHFYLLYISDDFVYVSNELKKYQLAQYLNLKKDSIYFYEIFHPFISNNPRLLVVKDLEVQLDTIYPSENMNGMVFKSLEMGKLVSQ